MKYDAINKAFTEKVAEYMSKGYTIHTSSMSGHQGEIAKIDLTNDKEAIRIWVDTKHNWNDDFVGNILCIYVGTRELPTYHDQTLWMKEFEIIDTKEFYEINRNVWYLESREEAIRCQDKHLHRIRDSRTMTVQTDICNERAIEIAANYMKRRYNYKRISRNNLKVVKLTRYGEPTRYLITYNGNAYNLRVKEGI